MKIFLKFYPHVSICVNYDKITQLLYTAVPPTRFMSWRSLVRSCDFIDDMNTTTFDFISKCIFSAMILVHGSEQMTGFTRFNFQRYCIVVQFSEYQRGREVSPVYVSPQIYQTTINTIC